MSIAAAVGAERLREIMTELVSRASTVVQRYGGTVDKFTGDGIMALFGEPVALEDHAFRACLAAGVIQEETRQLAAEMKRRDHVEVQLRVGLNSGQVIAGEIGAGTLGYTAIGEQVGMAQRMESVAPPGGVMLSESTARLVENAAVLGDAEMVCITGSDKAVPAPPRGRVGLAGSSPSLGDESRWAPVGIGHVDGCTGARDRRSGVCRWCHRTCRNRQEPPRWRVGDDRRKPRCRRIFGVLRIPHQRGPISRRDDAVSGGDWDRGSGWRAARAKVRTKLPEADAQDLLLFDDLLGIADPPSRLHSLTRTGAGAG
jgi:adenylate cyclase